MHEKKRWPHVTRKVGRLRLRGAGDSIIVVFTQQQQTLPHLQGVALSIKSSNTSLSLQQYLVTERWRVGVRSATLVRLLPGVQFC